MNENGLRRQEVEQRQKNARPVRARTLTPSNSSFLSQEDAPALEIHRTTCHFDDQNDIFLNLTFPCWKFLFLIPVFNYLYFGNRAAILSKFATFTPISWQLQRLQV